jgi:hypothetical protein
MLPFAFPWSTKEHKLFFWDLHVKKKLSYCWWRLANLWIPYMLCLADLSDQAKKPPTTPEDKFLVTKFEFGWSFGTILEVNCIEVKVTPNLKLLVTFSMSLEGVSYELYTWFHFKLKFNLERASCFQKILEKSSLLIRKFWREAAQLSLYRTRLQSWRSKVGITTPTNVSLERHFFKLMTDEKYRIICMFHMRSILQTALIWVNLSTVCLHINSYKKTIDNLQAWPVSYHSASGNKYPHTHFSQHSTHLWCIMSL